MPILSSWELSKQQYGSLLPKARAEVAAKGPGAYVVFNAAQKVSSDLATALEHEIARAEIMKNGGHLSFGEFFSNSETRRVLNREFYPLCTTDEMKMNFVTGLQQTWHEVMHELTGEHVYEVDPNLARMLKHTSMKGVNAEDMRLPYKNICVTVPEDIVGVNLISRRGSDMKLRHFYITEDVPDPRVRIRKTSPPGELGPFGFTRGQGREGPEYNEDFEGRVWRVLCFSGNPGEDQALERLTQYHIPLPNGASADEVIARMPMAVEGLEDVFRWVMNVVMYATWPDADSQHLMMNEEAKKLWDRIQKIPGKSPRKEALKERFKATQPRWRTVLGRRLPKWEANPDNAGTGSPLVVRTLVPGHWQHYWYGPKDGERVSKQKYRAPFWRGPAEGPESNPRHVLV